MEQKALQHLLATVAQIREQEETSLQTEDVIGVSETVSVAVSIYEVVRNTLEYDDEHLLRRNAIRRILKRSLAEEDMKQLANKLIRELIWARYLPNHRLPTSLFGEVQGVLEKYKLLFVGLEDGGVRAQEHHEWLLDVLSTELEYLVSPPHEDEALASYAYQVLRARTVWQSKQLEEADHDLQLYLAVHRSVLKSNEATLRYRLLTLYYPKWRTARADDAVVREVASHFTHVHDVVEQALHHPSGDAVYRFVRRHSVVFWLLADVIKDSPESFQEAFTLKDVPVLDKAFAAAATVRYRMFRTRLFRTVFRAAIFLLFTKSILAILIEYPYEILYLQSADFRPLLVNIIFPPFLLSVLGLSVRIPEKKNTEDILKEMHAFLGLGDDMEFVFKYKAPWAQGALWWIFHGLYAVVFFVVLGLIGAFLHSHEFNVLSIAFFLFFLSLVAYFGNRIRSTRRELVISDAHRGLFWVLLDVLFLPVVRAGRWVALRTPKVNIFLFFFDFIIEAPFKASFEIIESWLAFLREKRDEI